MLSAKGRNSMAMTAAAVPHRMKGIRRPIRVCTRSERLPNSGSMNTASTLSMAMMPPEMVSLTWKVFFRISGIRLS